MKLKNVVLLIANLALAILTILPTHAQTTLNLRVMAANITSGNGQSYETAGINIFKGLKPDVVAIQEFRYGSSSSASQLRALVDTAFGTNYSFYCESGYNIPNGIVSRYPIIAAGSWDDSMVADRGYAWAQIDLPGTNDLYVVSVHLYGSGSASDRNTEATELKSLIQANFPANAWVYVGGDFNTSSRSEACVTTFKTFLSDSPIPTDNNGDATSNEPRNKPYDYVLPSPSLAAHEVPSVIGSQSFNGLVFDSAVYTPLSDVSPVTSGDSHVTGMQHMAVIKDFSIVVTDEPGTNPPVITGQPASQSIAPGNAASFTVTTTGTAPFSYQWLFNGTNISNATTNPLVIASVQLTNAGNYSVVITNLYGSATSSVAVLSVSNTPPSITAAPQSLNVTAGQPATFSVTATGTQPLSFQWLFNGTNISNATTNPLVIASVSAAAAGNYSVVITNIAGSVTSSVAALTLLTGNPAIVAQWNFNSSPADSSTSTGSSVPSIGAGTATTVGGIVPSFVGGDTVLDTATDNTAWTTTTYPAAAANNKTAGVQFAVSTAGKQNIVISWSQRSSNTGGKYFRLQYSTDGTSFVDVSPVAIVTNVFKAFTNSLAAVPGVSNNASFAFRIVSEFESTATGSGSAAYVAAAAGSSYAATGTTRFDMVTVSGVDIVTNVPPVAPVFGALTVAAGQLQFTVGGTTGASYVVQATTNLGGTWTPVWTNTAPFSFTDADLGAGSQKFYRAVSAQ